MQLRRSTLEPTGIMKDILDNFEESYKNTYEGSYYVPMHNGEGYTAYYGSEYQPILRANCPGDMQERSFNQLTMIKSYYSRILDHTVCLEKGVEWSLHNVDGYRDDTYRLAFCQKLLECVLQFPK